MAPLKPLPALLLCALVVSIGLLVYEQWRLDGSPAVDTLPPRAADPKVGPEPEGATALARWQLLEQQVQRLRDDLDTLRMAASRTEQDRQSVDPLDPTALARLQRQLDELERQRAHERQLQTALARVAMLGQSLTPAIRDGVALRLAQYQTEVADLWAQAREALEPDLEGVRAQQEHRRQGAERDVRALLPAATEEALRTLLPPVTSR